MAKEQNDGKAEKLFQNFGKKVDKFIEELEEAGGKLNKEFDAKFNELREAADRVKKEAKSKERWDEVEKRLKKAGKEFENAFKAAFKK